MSRVGIEYCTPEDRFYNYCLWQYQPLESPAGRLRASNLLFHSFEVGGIHENAFRLVQLIRQQFGTGNTVWGVKLLEGVLKWEFYFYDYRRRNRERSISQLLDAIRPIVDSALVVNESPHYFMFSMDVDQRLCSGTATVDELHMYVGNAGSNVSSGISYSLTSAGNRLENLYYFFDARRHLDDIRAKICCSAFADAPLLEMDTVLWPELADCKTICLANKQGNDCIYYSGITVQQLLYAMTALQYPAALITFISENQASLHHLLYDFGIDYTFDNGRMAVVKSGYYGTF